MRLVPPLLLGYVLLPPPTTAGTIKKSLSQLDHANTYLESKNFFDLGMESN
jgi:hypothetical protein